MYIKTVSCCATMIDRVLYIRKGNSLCPCLACKLKSIRYTKVNMYGGSSFSKCKKNTFRKKMVHNHLIVNCPQSVMD